MTIPERIMEEARTAWQNASTVALRGDDVRIIARAIQAAEQRGAAREIVVKPLEWTNDGGRLWSATCPHTYLNYAVITRSSGLTEWRGAYEWNDALSEDAGKQCAQAEHEARIRSALTDPKEDGHE